MYNILDKNDAKSEKYLNELWCLNFFKTLTPLSIFYGNTPTTIPNVSPEIYNKRYDYNYLDSLFNKDEFCIYLSICWETSDELEDLIEQYIGRVSGKISLESDVFTGYTNVSGYNRSDILQNIHKLDFSKDLCYTRVSINDEWIFDSWEQELKTGISIKAIRKTSYDFGIVEFSFEKEEDYDKFLALYIVWLSPRNNLE